MRFPWLVASLFNNIVKTVLVILCYKAIFDIIVAVVHIKEIKEYKEHIEELENYKLDQSNRLDEYEKKILSLLSTLLTHRTYVLTEPDDKEEYKDRMKESKILNEIEDIIQRFKYLE
jgi:hypothetical protein